MEKIVLLLCMTQFITAALGMMAVVMVTTERRKIAERVEKVEKESTRQQETMDEAKKAAAEAQRLYEEGFVNLMQYDGRPRKKGEDE